MRWLNKPPKPMPEEGEERTIKKFLLFPLCLQNEYRWLEVARIKQVYRIFDYMEHHLAKGYWTDISWED